MKTSRTVAIAMSLVILGCLLAVIGVAVIFFAVFGGGMSQNCGSGVQVSGNGVPKQIWNFLASPPLNIPPAGDAGILGNAQQENGFSTADNSGGMGFLQWTGSRRAAEIALAARNNLQPTDIKAQLLYLEAELTGSPSAAVDERSVLQAIRTASTPAEGAVIWQNDFEHPLSSE